MRTARNEQASAAHARISASQAPRTLARECALLARAADAAGRHAMRRRTGAPVEASSPAAEAPVGPVERRVDASAFARRRGVPAAQEKRLTSSTLGPHVVGNIYYNITTEECAPVIRHRVHAR